MQHALSAGLFSFPPRRFPGLDEKLVKQEIAIETVEKEVRRKKGREIYINIEIYYHSNIHATLSTLRATLHTIAALNSMEAVNATFKGAHECYI